MDALKKYLYVSVIGTPGIGHSVFYNYFVQRYRQENPTKPIITAAFTEENELDSCVRFQSGEDHGVELDNVPKINSKDFIHLFDGSPKIKPRGQMVSPNYNYRYLMAKVTTHIVLYSSLWTLQELQDANDALNLGLTDNEIEDRYNLFGGTVRSCLTTNDQFYKREKAELFSMAESIKSFEQVKELLTYSARRLDVPLRIFHYVPKFSSFEFPSDFSLHICSAQIAQVVDSSIQRRYEDERAKWYNNSLWHRLLVKDLYNLCFHILSSLFRFE